MNMGKSVFSFVLLVVLGVALSCCSPGWASDRLATTAQAVLAGDRFLELEVQNVKRNEVHRTYHNGKKQLIGVEYTLTCKVVEDFSKVGPAAGETLKIRTEWPAGGLNKNHDEDGKLHEFYKAKRVRYDTFDVSKAKKGSRFLAVLVGSFFPQNKAWRLYPKPVAMRDVKERKVFQQIVEKYKAGVPRPTLDQQPYNSKVVVTSFYDSFLLYRRPTNPSMKGGLSLTAIHLFTPKGKFLAQFSLLNDPDPSAGWFRYDGTLKVSTAGEFDQFVSARPLSLGPDDDKLDKRCQLQGGKYTPTTPPAAALEVRRKQLEAKIRRVLKDDGWELCVATGVAGFTPKKGQDPGYTISARHKTWKAPVMIASLADGEPNPQSRPAFVSLLAVPQGGKYQDPGLKSPKPSATPQWGQSLDYKFYGRILLPSKQRGLEPQLREELGANWCKGKNSPWFVKGRVGRTHWSKDKRLWAWTTILNDSPETFVILSKPGETLEVYVDNEKCQPGQKAGSYRHYKTCWPLRPNRGAFFSFHVGQWIIPSTGKRIADSPDARHVRIVIKPFVGKLPPGMNPITDIARIRKLPPPEKQVTLSTIIMMIPPKE